MVKLEASRSARRVGLRLSISLLRIIIILVMSMDSSNWPRRSLIIIYARTKAWYIVKEDCEGLQP